MPFEKMRVQNLSFNPYLPVGSSDCNGHISRVRPRRSEKYGIRVFVFPLCLMSLWNTDTYLVQRSCPEHMLESKSPLFLSLSLSLSLSPLCPPSLALKSSCPNFTSGDTGWIISDRIAVQIFGQHFPSIPIPYSLYSYPISNTQAVVHKDLCIFI